jgi:hypothetical protein
MMTIRTVTDQGAPIPASGETAQPKSSADAGSTPVPQPQQGDAITTISGDYRQLAQLHRINTQANENAVSLRKSDEHLAQVGAKLSQMKNQLTTIVKNYPPYLLDDPRRIQFLRSFNGLRREIKQMTLPTDLKWYGKEAALSDVPAMPENASDGAVATASGQLNTAIAAVNANRSEIGSQAQAGSAVQAKTAALGIGHSLSWDLSLPESAYVQKSTAVRGELMSTPGVSITGGQADIAKLAG